MESKSGGSVKGRGFEPVSAPTQPVSGRSRSQISDIENSSSRDSSRNSRPSVRDALDFSPETRLVAANLRKCRLFAECAELPGRDRCGWLGSEDSNRDVSNSAGNGPARRQPWRPSRAKRRRRLTYSITLLVRCFVRLTMGTSLTTHTAGFPCRRRSANCSRTRPRTWRAPTSARSYAARRRLRRARNQWGSARR